MCIAWHFLFYKVILQNVSFSSSLDCFFGFKHNDFLLSFFLKVKVAKNWVEGLDSSVAGECETLELVSSAGHQQGMVAHALGR